jgi:hypothetical protein
MQKSLLQKLKPEFRKGLENNQKDYPVVIDNLILALDDEFFYNDLTINQVYSIFLFSDISGANRSFLEWRFGDDIFNN